MVGGSVATTIVSIRLECSTERIDVKLERGRPRKRSVARHHPASCAAWGGAWTFPAAGRPHASGPWD